MSVAKFVCEYNWRERVCSISHNPVTWTTLHWVTVRKTMKFGPSHQILLANKSKVPTDFQETKHIRRDGKRARPRWPVIDGPLLNVSSIPALVHV